MVIIIVKVIIIIIIAKITIAAMILIVYLLAYLLSLLTLRHHAKNTYLINSYVINVTILFIDEENQVPKY